MCFFVAHYFNFKTFYKKIIVFQKFSVKGGHHSISFNNKKLETT